MAAVAKELIAQTIEERILLAPCALQLRAIAMVTVLERYHRACSARNTSADSNCEASGGGESARCGGTARRKGDVTQSRVQP